MSETIDSSQQEKTTGDSLIPIEECEEKDIIFYNCDECSSLIEISSINENDNMIVFKCLNKEKRHEKQIKIKEYLEKMIKFKKKSLNEDVCLIHSDSENKNKYVSFCFDCNKHLCRKCLKDRTHLTHYKNNIIEIQIGLLVSALDIATANNTVAIVMAGPIAKQMGDEYRISPKKTASLLDIFSCVVQGILPYGAQMLVALSAISAALPEANVSAFNLIPYMFYPFLLLVSVLIFIAISPRKVKQTI